MWLFSTRSNGSCKNACCRTCICNESPIELCFRTSRLWLHVLIGVYKTSACLFTLYRVYRVMTVRLCPRLSNIWHVIDAFVPRRPCCNAGVLQRGASLPSVGFCFLLPWLQQYTPEWPSLGSSRQAEPRMFVCRCTLSEPQCEG